MTIPQQQDARRPYVSDPDFQLYVGDVREVLRELPSESVHCILTSPPFYGLRDYGMDGQIGLEATPEEWVSELVAVFEECRRILRSDGTLWIECGDSYNAGTSTSRAGSTLEGSHGYWENPHIKRRINAQGLKPKDIIGSPFLLAKALRDPAYHGRIKSERDRLWLAALIDSEGCIHIHRRKAGSDSGAKWERKDGTTARYERTQDTYGVMVSVSNTNEDIVARCHSLVGQGSRSDHLAGTGTQQRKRTLYRWTVTGQQARDLLREVYPDLVAKQHEARIAYHAPSSGKGAAESHEAVKALHNGRTVDVDPPAPPSLFAPGWYHRGTYIWAKSNAMPESAKDRCTTAHSYVFHFAKSTRYFFDGEAIAEPAAWERWGDQTVPKYEGTSTSTGWMEPKPKAELIAIGNRQTNGQKPRTDERRGFDNRLEREDGLKHPRSVWTIPTQGYPEAHFATWPEALAERIILAGCPKGGTVLDPFCGSGTTAVIAKRLHRRCIGVELNPEYAELAARRYARWWISPTPTPQRPVDQLSLLAQETS